MTGRVGRPPDGDSAQTRRNILLAARQRFAADGYRATTNRAIAHDVGITSGAIYHYFESKDELYAAVYCDTVDEMYNDFERVAVQYDSLSEQFAAVMRRSSDMQLDDPSISGFIVAVSLETKRRPELLELMAPQRGRHTRFFEGLVAQAVERKELPANVDQRSVVDLLGAVLTGIANVPAIAADPQRYAATVDALNGFIAAARR